MKKKYRSLMVVALVALAACARSRSGGSGGTTGSSDDGGVTLDEGGSPGVSVPPGSDSDATIVIPKALPEGGDSSGDGAPALAENGSGICVTARTCDSTCDELIENGQHEYIEQHPDDGSQIPAKSVSSLSPLFAGVPSAAGGPCIVEPPNGALYPNNWVRARIRFKPANSNQTIFQIRIHANRQASDLVVYTESKTWEIPKDIWTALAASTWGEDITVTVSASGPNGATPARSSVTFQIAPAFANGTIFYWAAVGMYAGQSWLESFSVGDDNVAVALTVPQVQWMQARGASGSLQTGGASPGAIACIGCHVAVPDRQSVTFLETYPWDGVSSMVDTNDTGKLPPWLTPGGAQALSIPWLGMMSFSPHVWNDSMQHIVVAALGGEGTFNASAFDGGPAAAPIAPWGYQGGNGWSDSPKSQLGWIDLSTNAPPVVPNPAGGGSAGDQLSLGMAANYGTTWGVIARTGDSSGVASPTWSHSGDTIVYASTNAEKDGRLAAGVADLWSVPYASGAGGNATPIQGASDPSWNEYYPSFSPDDQYVAFNRTPLADNMYYASRAQVYVIPAAGGVPNRLNANDPPACTSVTSPGITNSWPKWSPEYPKCGGKTYYWLIFSSAREKTPFGPQGGLPGENTSQLYLTALTVDETGLTSYPGIFIWNQHTTATVTPYTNQMQSNHTPQWEPIDLPPPPPPPPPPPTPPPPPM
jgi:hypothetical protein